VNFLAFMFASTNLIVELGLMILILLGWEFLVAELLGGLIPIAVMAVIVQLTLPETLFEEVRTELNQRDHDHGVTEDPTCGNGGARRVFARHGWWRDAEILFGGLYGDLSAGGGQQWELARRTPVGVAGTRSATSIARSGRCSTRT